MSRALGLASNPALRLAPEALDRYLEDWDEHLERLDAAVPEPTIYLVGRGASLAAVQTGALIIKEAAKTPVEGMSAPQFRHGPLELADDDVAVIVLAGATDEAALNRRTLDDIAQTGANAFWLSADAGPGQLTSPALPGAALALGEILPLQLLSVVLAERRGVEPGAFRQIEKITRTL